MAKRRQRMNSKALIVMLVAIGAVLIGLQGALAQSLLPPEVPIPETLDQLDDLLEESPEALPSPSPSPTPGATTPTPPELEGSLGSGTQGSSANSESTGEAASSIILGSSPQLGRTASSLYADPGELAAAVAGASLRSAVDLGLSLGQPLSPLTGSELLALRTRLSSLSGAVPLAFRELITDSLFANPLRGLVSPAKDTQDIEAAPSSMSSSESNGVDSGVTPAVAAGDVKVYADNARTTERTVFERGDTVYARATNLDSTKYYRFRLFSPSAEVTITSNCANGLTNLDHSYVIQPSDPLSGSISWRYELREGTTSGNCGGGGATAYPTSFQVAKALTFATALNRDNCASESCPNTKTIFGAGETAYARVFGFAQSQTDFDETWIRPSGGTACANTSGSDQPDSSSSGVVNTQYPLIVGPDSPCPALASGDDGLWQLNLAVDAARTVQLNAFTLDGTAPSAPSTPDLETPSDLGASNADNVTKDDTPTFTGTAEDGLTVKILSDGVEVGSGTASGGNYSITTSDIPDGTHSITATASDPAGNTSAASSSLSVTIDTVVPAPPSAPDLADSSDTGSSNSDNLTNDNTPTSNGTAENGSMVRVYRAGTTEVGSGTSNGSYSVTTSIIPDGTHTITAIATDAAGNASSASSGLSITIDTVVPTTPSTPDLHKDSDLGHSDTDNVTKDDTPTFEGTATDGTSVQILSDGSPAGSATAGNGNKYSVTTGDIPDGAHSITATATDPAGNTSSASSGLTVKIDTQDPNDPTGTSSTSHSPSTPSNDKTVDMSWNAATDNGEAGIDGYASAFNTTSTPTCDEGKDLEESATSQTSGNLADGSHFFHICTLDNAGNWTSTVTVGPFVIDTAAPGEPSAPDLDPSSDSANNTDNITNDNTPTFSGTAEANSTVRIFRSGSSDAAGSATTSSGGSYSVTTSQITDGAYTFTATATDAAGNASSASSGLSVTIDTAAPAAPSVPDLTDSSDSGSSSTDNLTNDNTPTFTGTSETGSTVKLFRAGTTEVGSGAASGGTYSVTSSTLADGTHSITATATDTAGNASSASSGLSVTIDTAAPAAPSVPDLTDSSDSGSSSTDNLTNDNTPTFTGTTEANTTVTLFRAGTTSIGSGSASGTNYSVTASDIPDGTHSITAASSDAAGNFSAASSGLTLEVDTQDPNDPTGTSSTSHSPSTPSIDKTVDMSWNTATDNGVAGIDGYAFAFNTTSSPTCDQGKDLEESSTSVTSGNLSDGSHYFHICTLDNAGNWTSTVTVGPYVIDTTAPGAPSLVAPEEGATTNDSTPTFDWSDVADATGVSYELQVDNSGCTFPSPEINQTAITTSGFTPGSGLADGAYCWRVKARDGAATAGEYSSNRNFTIQPAATGGGGGSPSTSSPPPSASPSPSSSPTTRRSPSGGAGSSEVSTPSPSPNASPDAPTGASFDGQTLALSTSDSSILPGDAVGISGDGFAPNSEIIITFESTPVVVGRVTAGSTGRFTTEVLVPADATPGSHTIKASGKAPDGSPRVISVPVEIASAEDIAASEDSSENGIRTLPIVAAVLLMLMSLSAVLVGRKRPALRV